jgi:hypothetical protein
VLDGVGVVQASLLQEVLEVICGWPRLTLATAYSCRGAYHARAARLLVVATVITGRRCDLLTALLASLLATHGTLLTIMDDNIG